MLGLKDNVIGKTDQHQLTYKHHQVFVLAGLLINNMDQSFIISKKQNTLVGHVFTPQVQTQHNRIKF